MADSSLLTDKPLKTNHTFVKINQCSILLPNQQLHSAPLPTLSKICPPEFIYPALSLLSSLQLITLILPHLQRSSVLHKSLFTAESDLQKENNYLPLWLTVQSPVFYLRTAPFCSRSQHVFLIILQKPRYPIKITVAQNEHLTFGFSLQLVCFVVMASHSDPQSRQLSRFSHPVPSSSLPIPM